MEWEVGWSGYGVVLSPRAPVGTSNTVRPNFEYRSAGPADFELRAGGGEGSPPHPPSSVSQVRPNFEYRSAGPADVELAGGRVPPRTLFCTLFFSFPDPRPTYTNFPFGPRPSSDPRGPYRDTFCALLHTTTTDDNGPTDPR